MEVVWKTVELRWFFRHPPSWLPVLFSALPQEQTSREQREDLYLHSGVEHTGIKLRNGRREIKTRLGPPRAWQEGRIGGFLENWEKRGFELSQASAAIRREKGWVLVRKDRMATLCRPVDGRIECRPAQAGSPPSCQVEYTEIEVRGSSWHTFGLEWPESGLPGWSDPVVWLPHLLGYLGVPGLQGSEANDPDITVLWKDTSMGYPAFLLQKMLFIG